MIVNKNTSDKELYKIIKNLSNNDDYYTKEERESIIINELLTSKKEITYDYLMSKTKTSKTTIVKDFALSEKWLVDRNIKVRKKTRVGIKLEYDELTFRNVSLEYIEKELKQANYQKIYNNFYGSDFFKLNLPMNNYISYVTKNVNVTMINNFIKKYENDFLIKFIEDSFIKIFLYLLITIKRISEGFSLEDKKHKAAL